jgi:ABC-2 type transport system permease protein
MIHDVATVFVGELSRRIRSRIFIVGLVFGLLTILALTTLPSLIGGTISASKTIVIVADPAIAQRASGLLSNDYVVTAVVSPQRVSAGLLRERGAAAAVVLKATSAGLGATIYARNPQSVSIGEIRRDLLPLQLQLAMRRSPGDVAALTHLAVDVHTIDSRFNSSAQAQMAQGVAYMLIILLYLLILMNSQLVMTAVAEEKTSRIAELLVASVDPSVLLAGKVLAGAVLAIVQLAVWIVAGVILGGGTLGIASKPTMAAAAAATGGDVDPFSLSGLHGAMSPALLIAFVLFFILGFLQLSTLQAAGASLVNRTEDLGSIAAPLFLPIMAALMIAIPALNAPDASWAVTFSFVPLFSPFVMFARMAVSNVPLSQVLVSLAVNAAALALIAIAAGKIYRVGMLLYGRSPKLKQIWTVLRSN